METIKKKNESKSFKCAQCDFCSKSDQGLKTHIRRKHTAAKSAENVKETCSKLCDLCGKLFEGEKEMKKHQKTHSFKQIEFKFEEYAHGQFIRSLWRCT